MSTERKLMTIEDLKIQVDNTLAYKSGREIIVCIPNNKGGMGGTPATNVIAAHGGIDWDSGKFLIQPQVKMIEMPPDFTESKFQEALQRIKSLEMIVGRLIGALEAKDEKEIHFATRFAKTSMDAFKKHPIK